MGNDIPFRKQPFKFKGKYQMRKEIRCYVRYMIFFAFRINSLSVSAGSRRMELPPKDEHVRAGNSNAIILSPVRRTKLAACTTCGVVDQEHRWIEGFLNSWNSFFPRDALDFEARSGADVARRESLKYFVSKG